MKKNTTKLAVHSIITGAAVAGIVAGTVALADQQTRPATVVSPTSSCAGKYTAYAKMTNINDGSTWVVPPTNIVVTNGLFSDQSTISQPYSSYAMVTPYGGLSSCGSNHITFAATNGGKYTLTVIITNNPTTVTNGEQMTLNVQWNVP
jgi:hypothetical protein